MRVFSDMAPAGQLQGDALRWEREEPGKLVLGFAANFGQLFPIQARD
jgi:hypothetical protein